MKALDLAHGVSDPDDRLIDASEVLADWQRRCGGELPGVIAIPALLELVRSARRAGTPLARTITFLDETRVLSTWAAVTPEADGTRIELSRWRTSAVEDGGADAPGAAALVRQIAEAQVLLDAEQRVVSVDAMGADLAGMAAAMREGIGRRWTEFVTLAELEHHQSALHWRLLDDAAVGIDGSDRPWRARLFPMGDAGFELLLVPDGIGIVPHESVAPSPQAPDAASWNGIIGRELAPALRQPINRIIANAETIRTRLAGPLSDEYSTYAGDIAEAGRHLLGLIEDLADLEAVEAEGFKPAPDRIDLADCARRAAGILSVRAQERAIRLATPAEEARTPAIGEFRRVLQILINLLNNAIRYTPGSSTVTLTCWTDGVRAWLCVADEGQGLTQEQVDRLFAKFERLGRSGDGGTGLGLYISRRLARAMGGDLSVEATPGQGARFVLELPADTNTEMGVSEI
jgi:signal transduction histidine kinase